LKRKSSACSPQDKLIIQVTEIPDRIFFLFFLLFIYKLYQFKAGAPRREGSELSLKKVKREQIEEEAGNHRGLSATEGILVHGPLLRSTTLSPTAFRVFVGSTTEFR
jgi:hypothetical protein